MRFDFIRWSDDDVDAAAIRFPSRNAGGKMFVGVGDAAVVLVLKFVFGGVRSRITALPERLDEVLAFFVVRQLLERRPLLVGDDPGNVLVEPHFIAAA